MSNSMTNLTPSPEAQPARQQVQLPESVELGLRGSDCLVTGGAGFIGSNLVRALLRLDARVTVVDNLSTGRRDHLPSSGRLTLVEDDIVTLDGLPGLVSALHALGSDKQ